ncbi:MAG: hypothetical protein ACR2FO_00465 [Actinomycetota bacterium]
MASNRALQLRFHFNEEAGHAHVHLHGVDEAEVAEVLAAPIEDGVGQEGARIAVGQTDAGRYLKVIYVPDLDGEGAFVITSFSLGPKALKALRRRIRRRQ